MITVNYEDTLVGTRTSTASRTIDEDYVHSFADLTWDRHLLHMDPTYAARTRFGGQIAHGALLLSTLLGLVDLDARYIQCFYGIDELQFRAPVYFGDTVHVESEVIAVAPRAERDSGVVTCRGTLLNQDGKTVLVGRFSFLVASRDTALTVDGRPQ